jgi:cyanophycinase
MSTPLLRPHLRPSAVRSALAGALLLTVGVAPGLLSAATTPTFVPIGAGYEADTLQQFATEAAKVDSSSEVSILVLPIAYGVDPLSMSNGLRNQNLTLADNRRGQIEAACQAVIPSDRTCHVVLAPVLVRADAFLEANLDLVTDGLDGIFVLGGDQDVAMEVVNNTPFEDALARVQAAGAVTSGNSAGAAVESADMIAGFIGSNGPEQGLEENSVDVWSYSGPTDTSRGLVFGLQDVLLDQHVFQRGRIARLINASFAAGELGIGVDANTAATIEGGNEITKIGGDTGAFVADSISLNASAHFDASGTLSIHDVATQILPAGDRYNMTTRQPILSNNVGEPAPDITVRAFPTLVTPDGSGPLLLGGGSPSATVLDRLVAASGGSSPKIVVIAAGYAKPEIATKDAKDFAASLAARGATATWFVLNAKTKEADVTAALSAAQGVLLTAPDPSTILSSLAAAPAVTAGIHSAWLGGAAVLANDAAASAVSDSFTADARPGDSTGQIESAAIAEFHPSSVHLVAGLGWVDVGIEPGIVSNRHWGRLYSVVGAQANHLAFGIDAGTAIEFGETLAAPRVVGDSAAVALDGQYATFGVGSNDTLAAHWVILDTFVGGESIAP